MKKIGIFIYQLFLILVTLGLIFIPFSFQYLDFQPQITNLLFGNLIQFIASNFDGIHVANSEITSDSTTLYLLFFILLILALISRISLSFSYFWKIHQIFIIKTIQMILTFYLSCLMLKYGFDKIFKSQFYLPEPNTLYTPLGLLDRDILFWSAMGSSYSYNFFMGAIEVIPALMLLYKKTRILGLFILFGVLTNVVFINFGFDISVKLYSSFLLLICFLLLIPSLNRVWQFFILNKTVALTSLSGNDLCSSKTIRLSIKSALILFLFFESLYPYIQKNEFNDDTVLRNPLHGAYEVIETKNENEKKNAVDLKIKRIFIHRKNYLIFQYADDKMEDFYLEINSSKNQFLLSNYHNNEKIKMQYKYSYESKILKLESQELGITIYSKSLPWKKLPLLQPLFHWTVDGIH